MPSKSTVPQSRRATTFKARDLLNPLAVLRAIAASWRSGAPYQRQILNGLQDGRPIYSGTVSNATIAKRRARNKVGRRSRRINRMVAKR